MRGAAPSSPLGLNKDSVKSIYEVVVVSLVPIRIVLDKYCPKTEGKVSR